MAAVHRSPAARPGSKMNSTASLQPRFISTAARALSRANSRMMAARSGPRRSSDSAGSTLSTRISSRDCGSHNSPVLAIEAQRHPMAHIGTPIGRRPRGDDACLSSANRRRQGRAPTIHGVERLHMRRCDRRERKLLRLRVERFRRWDRERASFDVSALARKVVSMAPAGPTLSGASRMDRRAASARDVTVPAGTPAVSAGAAAEPAGWAGCRRAPRMAGVVAASGGSAAEAGWLRWRVG